MDILGELLRNIGQERFFSDYFGKHPYACPSVALAYRRFLSWDLLQEILLSGHDDCWLPKEGKLPTEPNRATGRLTFNEALQGYAEGRTILVRRAERINRKLAAIAENVHKSTNRAVNIQLYYTPPGERGLDWHFDNEDVFVIQSFGEKEFTLARNALASKDNIGTSETLKCLLVAGDLLYIPAGHLHRACACENAPSFHLSIGVSRFQAIPR